MLWIVGILAFLFLGCPSDGFPQQNNNLTNENGELVSLLVIFRHGDRGPSYIFPNDPYSKEEYWPQGYGQLTKFGIQRHYKLGQWLRERYNNFLPKIYSPKDLIVSSTDLDRTLMSASSNLAGLYPPVQDQIWNENLIWQPIPIHSNAEDDIVPDRDDCANYQKEYKKVKKNQYFTDLNKKYANLIADISKKTGTEFDDIKALRQVRDLIYVYENYNKSYIPSWAAGFDRKTLDVVTGIFFQRRTYTDKLKQYLAGLFLNTLTNHFDEAVTKKEYKKLYMISAHESSLCPILDSLHAYDFFPPDFAATIIFELRKNSTDHFINVYYKQFSGTKLLSVGDCGSKCEYGRFKEFVSNYSLTYKQWKKECGNDVY